jgi:hypothetical protein
MLPEAQVAHKLPGRIRIRIPSRRRDAAFFAEVAARAARLPGVERVEANALTGAVLLAFRGEVRDIAADCERAGMFRFVSLAPVITPVSAQWSELVGRVDREIRSASARELDLGMFASIVLLALATYQLSRGQVLGPAVTLLFQAMTAYSLSRKSLPKEDLDGDEEGVEPEPVDVPRIDPGATHGQRQDQGDAGRNRACADRGRTTGGAGSGSRGADTGSRGGYA